MTVDVEVLAETDWGGIAEWRVRATHTGSWGGWTGQAEEVDLPGIPYQLRHRRISLWHREGVPFVEIAQRVGHARTSMTADVYSHVLLDDDLPKSDSIVVAPVRASEVKSG